MDKISWAKWFLRIPNWIKSTIGFITLIISFIIFTKKNFYLSIVVIIGLLILVLFFLNLYIVFSKTEPLIEGGKGVYKFPKYRLTAFFFLCLIFVATAISFIYTPSRYFIIESIFPTEEVKISRVVPLYEEDKEAIGYEVLIINGKRSDIWIDTVVLQVNSNGNIYCYCPDGNCESLSRYTVFITPNGQINVASIEGNTVTEESITAIIAEEKTDTSYLVSGKFELAESCNFHSSKLSFELTIPVNVLVPAKGRARMQFSFSFMGFYEIYSYAGYPYDEVDILEESETDTLIVKFDDGSTISDTFDGEFASKIYTMFNRLSP